MLGKHYRRDDDELYGDPLLGCRSGVRDCTGIAGND